MRQGSVRLLSPVPETVKSWICEEAQSRGGLFKLIFCTMRKGFCPKSGCSLVLSNLFL